MSDSSTPSSTRSSSLSSSPPSTPPNLHQNTIDPDAKWLVQKFGGTSIGKFPVKIAQEIISNYIDCHKVAVVCSARSGSTKALGTTNLLLQAASEALNSKMHSSSNGAMTPLSQGLFGTRPPTPGSPRNRSSSRSDSELQPLTAFHVPQAGDTSPEFNTTIDLIRQEHIKVATDSISDPDILQAYIDEIDRDCDWLRSFLFASQVIHEISPRAKDTIVGLGERMACKFMTAVLRDQGIDAEYVSLENIVPVADTDHVHGALSQEFYDTLAVAVGERIKECGNRVPVVTGFFGPVPGSLLSQIGRGYTDLLSALLAVGLEAAELQIWKEVDGIFTADPRKVPTARVISIISPDEAAELTYYGSEVVHPFTMEQVIRRKIPIRIKNVENPVGGGTVIFPDQEVDGTAVKEEIENESIPEPASPTILQALSSLPSSTKYSHKKLPTAVTIKERILVVNVNSNKKSVSHGFLAGIFTTLDRFGVVVDLISTSEVHVSMAIEDTLGKRMLDRLVKELRKSGTVSIHQDMAILSLVGKHMRNMVGIAGRMFSTLAQGNVNIEMISQGASEINISCVIDAKDAVKALNMIHQSCLQIPPQGRLGPWLF